MSFNESEILMLILTCLILGCFGGFVSGLFGSGGGVIVVPFFSFILTLYGIDGNEATHFAIGTSLACMTFTSLSSTLTHHKKKSISWPIFYLLGFGVMLGSVMGALFSVNVNGQIIKFFLGCFVLLIGLQIYLDKKPALCDTDTYHAPKVIFIVAGIVIGTISAFFGIGGSILVVPLLLRCKLNIRQAIGTAASCTLPVAFIGTTVNLVTNSPNYHQIGWTTGYICWSAFLSIIIASVPFAILGAKCAHRWSVQRIRKYFSIFLFVVGFKLFF